LSVRRFELCLVLATLAACSSTATSATSVAVGSTPSEENIAESIAPSVSLLSPTSSTALSQPPFFCGEFGREVLPLVVALDRRTGAFQWRSCAEPDPAATPSDHGAQDQRLISSRALVIFGRVGVGTVDAFDPTTGARLFSHPAADGMPVVAERDLVIEARGIGFTEPPPGAHPADAGQVTLRAVDVATGTTRWTLETTVIPPPYADQKAVTAGNGRLAVARPGITVVYDIDDLTEVRREEGQWHADGDVLVRNNHTVGSDRFEVLEAEGTRLFFGDEFITVGYGTSSADLLVSRSTGEYNSVSTELIDRATRDTNWTLDHGYVVDGLDGAAAVIDDARLRLVDGATGDVMWTYDTAAYGVRLVDAEIGEELVFLVPTHALD